MRRFLLFISVLSVLTLYLLIVATGYADKLSKHFWYVAGFCVLLTVLLLAVLLRELWKLLRDAKRRVFGAKLSRRLVGMFAWVAILPGVFVLAVSVQFILYSINSWFGGDTAAALDRSVALSRDSLDAVAARTVQQAQTVRDALAQSKNAAQALPAAAGVAAFTQLIVFSGEDGKPLARLDKIDPPLPLPDKSELSGSGTDAEKPGYISIGNILYVQGRLKIAQPGGADCLLFYRRAVPEKTASDVMLIENARARYASLSFAKRGLQIFFLLTLLMATLLAMTLAVLTAIFFARRFVAPLQSLAAATRAVGQGDFTRRAPVYRSDEMGILSARFNRMTEQLQAADEATMRLHREQEAARRHLELILASLSTGVMTLDTSGCLKTYNAGAQNILQLPLYELIGQPLDNWQKWGSRSHLAAQLLKNFLASESDKPEEYEYSGADTLRILLGKAAYLPNDEGIVAVFDDVTDLVSAQKEAAWGEVARRLAHEIRNPLTPIQLSAERMAWKLQDKLSPEDAHILQRATGTIVKQVGALQEMVESFRNYARSVTLKLQKIRFNDIISEVLLLYEGSGSGFRVVAVEEDLWIRADATAIRQVLHNIFKNAAEAAAEAQYPEVLVSAQKNGENTVLAVENNGAGFPEKILKNAFEPYVTTKKTGTGLGLAVVRKIIEEHSGSISLSNRAEGGARVVITLPPPNMEKSCEVQTF